MARRSMVIDILTLPIEEEHISCPPPTSHTLFGSESSMVCTIKRLPTNEFRYICTSDKTQKTRCFILYVLDQCIDQLHILSGGRAGGTHHLAIFDDVLNVKTEDASVYDPIYDPQTGQLFWEAFKRTQMNKHYCDSAKLKDFLNAVRNEIRDFHSFKMFRDSIHNVQLKLIDGKRIFKESIENYNKMKEMKLAVATYTRDSRLELHKMNTSYLAATESVQRLLLSNLIQLRYAKSYENSRQEQNQIKCERECREMQNIISKYRHKIALENRVNNEITSFLNYSQKDLRNDIDVWVNKYNKDMEDYHLKILQINERLEEKQKYHEELKILYADHKKSIEDFKDYKEKKRIKDEEKQRLVDAATKIQAWWRGTMYRRQLGPYNPNKSAGGKRRKTKKKK